MDRRHYLRPSLSHFVGARTGRSANRLRWMLWCGPHEPRPGQRRDRLGGSAAQGANRFLGAVRLVNRVTSSSKSASSSNPLYTEAKRTAATASSS